MAASRDAASASPPNADFVRLFVANQRRIHAFIRTMVPNGVDAEEVLQETSITGWSKFPTVADRLIGNPDAFVMWSCTIARYEALKHYRKHKPKLPLSEQALEDIADRQIQQAEYLEMRHRTLATCLGKLSTRDRDLVRRRFDLDQRPREIAEQLGQPVNSVYKALQRIRGSLWECANRMMRAEGYSR